MFGMHRLQSLFLAGAVAAASGGHFPLAAHGQDRVPPAPQSVGENPQVSSEEPVLQPLAPTPSPTPAYVSPYDGTLWERPVLLGGLGGRRDELQDNGWTFNLSTTQFYQGVASGGIERDFRYAGRNDYFLNIDGEKAGLWRGLFVTLHGETRYGETVNFSSGAIMPPNVGMLFPAPNGSVSALTAVKVTQALSENFLVFGGKLNLLDELVQPYSGGRGVDAFMNAGLAFPVAAARTIPYSTLGAGFAVLRDMAPVFSFMVLDTNNTPTSSGFESFFDNGATMLAKVDVPVSFLDLPGHQGLWGTYSSGKYNDLRPTPYFDPNYGPMLVFAQDTGSWSVFYSADQALFVDPCNAKRSWGVFTNIGLADDGPSPVRWSANVGLGGSSPFQSRPLDTFGVGYSYVGYSYVGYSSPVKELAPVLLPVGDDQAVEVFYNYAVTPWFRLTPDLQVLIPARERTLPPGAQSIDTAVVLGLRAKISF